MHAYRGVIANGLGTAVAIVMQALAFKYGDLRSPWVAFSRGPA